MEFQRLSFTIPVLAIAGALFATWGYYEGGESKLIEHAVAWLAASTVAILLGLWLRRSSQVKK